jgi:hypothetical protein
MSAEINYHRQFKIFCNGITTPVAEYFVMELPWMVGRLFTRLTMFSPKAEAMQLSLKTDTRE